MSDALTTPRIIFCRVQPPELYRKNLKVAPPPLAVYSYKVRNQIAFTVVINDLFTAIRSYHTAGRPTGVSNGILDITGDKSLVHTYDGQACRVTRTVREWSGTGWRATETVQFIYDGWNPIAKYFSDESPPEVYLWGLDLSGSMQGAGGVGGLLAVPWDGFDTFYPTYDGNGNVSEYLDTAGTNIVHYEYDPSGGLTRLTGNTSTRFQYRFSTKLRDLSTGLYYYGYRYYDPLTGRWPSRDPIEERGGVNLYGFAGNDGIGKIDILGWYSNEEGFMHWLIGFGAAVSLKWSDFDPHGNSELTLKAGWQGNNQSRIKKECSSMEENSTKNMTLISKETMTLGGTNYKWINEWQATVEGYGNNNVTIWKIKKAYECSCLVIADLRLSADDRSNFNKDEAFEYFKIPVSDNVPLWFQRNLGIGVDYNIHAWKDSQVEWEFSVP